jgi:hypothetical protein
MKDADEISFLKVDAKLSKFRRSFKQWKRTQAKVL